MKDGRKFISVQFARHALVTKVALRGHWNSPTRISHISGFFSAGRGIVNMPLRRTWDNVTEQKALIFEMVTVWLSVPLPLVVSPSLALSLLAFTLISWNTNVFCRLLFLLSGSIKRKWACREQGWGNNYLEKQMRLLHKHLNLAETDRDARREAKYTHSYRIMYDSVCP